MSEKYRDETEEDRDERGERSMRRYNNWPMPVELHQIIADEIEPHTMNMGHDHGDTMICVEVAWPFILDYLAEHPEILQEHTRG